MNAPVERSKFHELYQRCRDRDRVWHRDPPFALLDAMAAAPKFVFTHDIMDFIDTHFEDYRDALMFAVGAGHSDLPHNPMLVEFDNHPSLVWNRNFWLITKHGEQFNLSPAMIDQRNGGVFDGYFPITLAGDGSHTIADFVGSLVPGMSDEQREHLSRQAYIALFFAMALHVRGVVQRLAPPVSPKLQAARAKRRQFPITTDYVTVHIGFVTDREGKQHEYKEGLGWHVRMHIRRGHYRNQAYGPGRLEHKEIWIPQTIVNYGLGDEFPEAKYLVVP